MLIWMDGVSQKQANYTIVVSAVVAAKAAIAVLE